MKELFVVNHPLINHKISFIRSVDTATKDFRQTVSEIGGLMAYEVTKNFQTKDVVVQTPICETVKPVLEKDVVIVPILRAGLGMVEGIHNMIPFAKVGHIGMYRDETTLEPCEYYAKFPDGMKDACVLVVDPMLATGGSAIMAIDAVKQRGATDIRFVGLVGAPEGVDALHKAHPDIPIFLATLDEKLNELGYIVPGLGDCGDRLFGTK